MVKTMPLFYIARIWWIRVRHDPATILTRRWGNPCSGSRQGKRRFRSFWRTLSHRYGCRVARSYCWYRVALS